MDSLGVLSQLFNAMLPATKVFQCGDCLSLL